MIYMRLGSGLDHCLQVVPRGSTNLFYPLCICSGPFPRPIRLSAPGAFGLCPPRYSLSIGYHLGVSRLPFALSFSSIFCFLHQSQISQIIPRDSVYLPGCLFWKVSNFCCSSKSYQGLCGSLIFEEAAVWGCLFLSRQLHPCLYQGPIQGLLLVTPLSVSNYCMAWCSPRSLTVLTFRRVLSPYPTKIGRYCRMPNLQL